MLRDILLRAPRTDPLFAGIQITNFNPLFKLLKLFPQDVTTGG